MYSYLAGQQAALIKLGFIGNEVKTGGFKLPGPAHTLAMEAGDQAVHSDILGAIAQRLGLGSADQIATRKAEQAAFKPVPLPKAQIGPELPAMPPPPPNFMAGMKSKPTRAVDVNELKQHLQQNLGPAKQLASKDPSQAIQVGRQLGAPVVGTESVLDQLSRTGFDKLSSAPIFRSQNGMLVHEIAPGVTFSLPEGPKAEQYKAKIDKEHGFVGSTAPTSKDDPPIVAVGKAFSRGLDRINPDRPRYASLMDLLLGRPDPKYRKGSAVLT